MCGGSPCRRVVYFDTCVCSALHATRVCGARCDGCAFGVGWGSFVSHCVLCVCVCAEGCKREREAGGQVWGLAAACFRAAAGWRSFVGALWLIGPGIFLLNVPRGGVDAPSIEGWQFGQQAATWLTCSLLRHIRCVCLVCTPCSLVPNTGSMCSLPIANSHHHRTLPAPFSRPCRRDHGQRRVRRRLLIAIGNEHVDLV